jgi:signal transduction histidine kinase
VLSSIPSYFIPKKFADSPELWRKYKLITSVILITALFDLNYVLITVLIEMKEGTYSLLITFLMHVALLFLIKSKVTLLVIGNLYIFFGATSVYVCIYYSGGFNSPVMPWLASSPVVALLIAGKKSGIIWVSVNMLVAVIFSILNKNNYAFPENFDKEWFNFFYTNTITGLILIVFLVSLVFENGKNSALRKLEEKSLLLAEEKKKVALHRISQEIHDNVGQTLSLVKINLHLIDMLKQKESELNITDSINLLGKAIENLRDISHELYSDGENVNLEEFVKITLQEVEKTKLYEINLNIGGGYNGLDPQAQFILSRVFKEVINNIIKHSNAKKIDVNISQDDRVFKLSIKDDGYGMDMKSNHSAGQGIKSIYTRVKLIGGDCKINSALNSGTVITIELPT